MIVMLIVLSLYWFCTEIKNISQASLSNYSPGLQLELIFLVFQWLAIFESLVISFEYEIFMFHKFIFSIK